MLVWISVIFHCGCWIDQRGSGIMGGVCEPWMEKSRLKRPMWETGP
jgi:hypothetical protein